MVVEHPRAVVAGLAVAAGILVEGLAISEALPAALGAASGTSEAPIAIIVITGIILDLMLAIIVQVITAIALMVIVHTAIGLMAMVIGHMVTALITGPPFMAIRLTINGTPLQHQLYIFNGKKLKQSKNSLITGIIAEIQKVIILMLRNVRKAGCRLRHNRQSNTEKRFNMSTSSRIGALLIVFPLTACVSLPTGPSVMALPGSGKGFEQFRYDDYQCRQYAYQQVGGEVPKQAATSSGAKSAAVGAGLGAVAGTAIGGGEGAAIGAGTGLLAGGVAGSESARTSGYIAQQRYDMSYIQCMYAQGHRVPVAGKITSDQDLGQKNSNVSKPPPGFTPPPPPPGNPPPPPQ